MEQNTVEIWYYCYSEKEPVSIGYGFEIDENDCTDAYLNNSINLNFLEESYWECSCDFEPGIQKAQNLLETGKYVTLREALKEIFGHFIVHFRIKEVEKELENDLDEFIYSLIEQTI